jgi:hypothetical protein
MACDGRDGPSLTEWMTMTQEEFSRRFKGSPIERAKRRGLQRNAAVALGNWGAPEAVPALAASLNDKEPLVRGDAAWVLGRIAAVGVTDGRGAYQLLVPTGPAIRGCTGGCTPVSMEA